MSDIPRIYTSEFHRCRDAMTDFSPAWKHLERGRRQSGFAVNDLWLKCFEMGSNGSLEHLEAILEGTKPPSRGDYDLIAHCLNERLKELGVSLLVPYGEEIGF